MAAEQVSWRQRKKDAVTAMLASGSEAGDRMRASRIAALLAVRWGRAARTPHASRLHPTAMPLCFHAFAEEEAASGRRWAWWVRRLECGRWQRCRSWRRRWCIRGAAIRRVSVACAPARLLHARTTAVSVSRWIPFTSCIACVLCVSVLCAVCVPDARSSSRGPPSRASSRGRSRSRSPHKKRAKSKHKKSSKHKSTSKHKRKHKDKKDKKRSSRSKHKSKKRKHRKSRSSSSDGSDASSSSGSSSDSSDSSGDESSDSAASGSDRRGRDRDRGHRRR